MTFHFEHPDLPVDDNVRLAAKDEFDRAIADVAETGFEVHGTVRNVRRRLKRVRAILRLIRPVFPDYAAENAALRDIGAECAGLRDAMALVEAVDELAAGRDGDEAQALEVVRRTFAERAAMRESELDRDAFLLGMRAKLRDARVRSELWELQAADRRAIVPGFAATYRQGRKGLAAVEAEPTEENLHEFRKAVKHHWAQLRLLRRLMPDFAASRVDAAAKLSRRLGKHQNLYVLRAAVAEDAVLTDVEGRAAIEQLIEQAMNRLARRSVKLGRRLFAERPKEVERRWIAYWRDWQAAEALR